MKQANETVNPPKTEEKPNLNLKNQEETLNFKKSDFLRGKGLAQKKPNSFRPIVFRGTQHRG